MSNTLGDIQPEESISKAVGNAAKNVQNSEVFKSAVSLKNAAVDLADGSPALVKETIAENLSTAAVKVHDTSDSAQQILNSGADKLHDYAQTTIGKVNNLGHRAADVLETSSGYVRDFDLANAREQVKATISKRPDVSMAVAGVFGLLMGLLIGKRLSRTS